MRNAGVGRFDPRNPWHVLFVALLTLLVLGWFIWVWAQWPESLMFGRP
jgi:hypothetical protein